MTGIIRQPTLQGHINLDRSIRLFAYTKDRKYDDAHSAENLAVNITVMDGWNRCMDGYVSRWSSLCKRETNN